MKRIILVICVLLITSACGITSSDQSQKPKESSNQSATKIIEATASPTEEPVREDPDLLLSYAQRYFDEKNLTEVNIILNKIKQGTPEASDQIEAVQKMSDELIVILEQEAAEKKAAEEAAIKAKLDKMKVELDEVTEVKWYRDKSTTQYVNENAFYLYIGEKPSVKPVLRLKIQYAGDNWLFIEKYIIKTDNETFEISPSYSDVKRDNKGGKVWEYIDVILTAHQAKMIDAIISSDKTIIRHAGDQYYKDRTITSKEKTALTNVLEAYEALGGELPKE